MLRELSKVEQRYDAVLAVIREGMRVTEVAEKFGVHGPGLGRGGDSGIRCSPSGDKTNRALWGVTRARTPHRGAYETDWESTGEAQAHDHPIQVGR